MHQPSTWLKWILGALLWAGVVSTCFSQTVEREKLMVAYINSFAKNIEWSEEKTLFRIQVVSTSDQLEDEFDRLASVEKIKGASIEVIASPSAVISQNTDLIYVDREFNTSVRSIYDQIKGDEILLVTDDYKDDRFIMINFIPGEAQTITFKLNRANITNQGLKVLPRMILLGGSDVDVAGLYSQVQDSVRDLELKIEDLQSQFDNVRESIAETTENLQNQEKIIADYERQINQKQEIITIQQSSLDSLLQRFSESESGLSEIVTTLRNRENELLELQNEIDSQRTQIEDGKLILEEQFRLIKEQDNLLSDKETSLDEMGSTIDLQTRRVWLLILFLITVFIFLILLFRAYRIRRNQARLLSEQKDELSSLLNELREAQSQLVQSEKMASLGVLTAGIAHEINNAINFVVSGIHVLEQNFIALAPVIKKVRNLKTEDEQLKKKVEDLVNTREKIGYNNIQKTIIEVVKHVKIGAERTTSIVKGLRSFSRSETDELGKIDIHNDIDIALLLLQNRYKDKVKISKSYDNDIPLIDGYTGQMGQVFLNIIGNAIDALEGEKKPAISITTKLLKKKLTISIRDNGEGMEQEVMDKIFDPFFTTKKVGTGTGLGLSITYGIIEKHKGEIKVKSKINSGTEFNISLPLKID